MQFVITITFHIIFPALSIGLASYLLIVEGLWLKTQSKYLYLSCRFWTKVLALTFGMGIISGLVMEFQIGTNWAGFSKQVGPVLGVLFVFEALSAFFIEATFLGFMLFGWNKISKAFHYFCTIMVFIGVSLSAFWILAANSWMQTPAGFVYRHQHFIVKNWEQVIFNHSTLIRYTHMLLAAYIASLMVIIAVCCHYFLKKNFRAFALTNLKIALPLLLILITSQIIIGDNVGLEVHHYQPIKTAAIEGLWKTTRGAPLLLFADIKQHKQRNGFEIKIPHLASLINTHQWDGKLIGLDTVSPSLRPLVPIVFYSFRIMVGVGIIILLFSIAANWQLLRRKLITSNSLLKIGRLLAPSGLIALITGWYVAETGRQPWVVYHYLKTSSAVSHVSLEHVVIGFLLIILVYGIIFGFFFNYYLLKIINKGPKYALPSHHKEEESHVHH